MKTERDIYIESMKLWIKEVNKIIEINILKNETDEKLIKLLKESIKLREKQIELEKTRIESLQELRGEYPEIFNDNTSS